MIQQRRNGFAGTAAIATMHGKEEVIAPILADSLGLHVTVAHGIDTDALGTFTGETPRAGSARDAAFAKARLALRHMPDAAFGIGSEGSFSPHPYFPFGTVGRELVVLLSSDDRLTLVGHDVTTETNCSETIVTTIEDALGAARRFSFPTHGAVVTGVRNAQPSVVDGLTKGITSETKLRDTVGRMLNACGAACIQSDMRAHLNPTRMHAIERAARDLVRIATSLCPQCEWPGYDVVERLYGLPCVDCNAPTEVTRAVVYACAQCARRDVRPRSDGRNHVSAAECGFCNP